MLSFLSFHDLNMFDDNKSVLLYVFQFGFIVLLAFLKKNVLMFIMFSLIGVRTLGERAKQDEGKEISLEERGPIPLCKCVYLTVHKGSEPFFMGAGRGEEADSPGSSAR